MKKKTFYLFIFFVINTSTVVGSLGSKLKNNDLDINPSANKLEQEIIKTKKKILSSTKYNQNVGFFIDMKIPSNKNRFFVYDFNQKKIIDKGLVAHGSGSEIENSNELIFSNVPNSYCTSIGMYEIGYSYQGMFGKAYKLYGLEPTNSKAFERFVVLHQYECVPYEEQVDKICNSQGCAMVNTVFYRRLEQIIDNTNKKIILNIFY
jgi:hypothetical protein